MASESAQGGWIVPDWPATWPVRCVITTRAASTGLGTSVGCFGAADGSNGLNLGLHSGDDVALVARNRQALARQLGVSICWLQQVHGTHVAYRQTENAAEQVTADGCWTDQRGLALAVLVADCMPVLFTDRQHQVVAAAHAGWRGLASGVLEATVAALPVAPERLMAYLGPVIGRERFEVGQDVYDAFVGRQPRAVQAFVASQPGKWRADLPALARQRLQALGVTVYGEPPCTFGDVQRFYSFRRDRRTGRMAAIIWLDANP